jgi:hypothetical protein
MISRQQLYGFGVTPRQLDLRVKTGEWIRILPQVFRLGVFPESIRQRAWATVLWAGPTATLSHRFAAWLC